MLLPGSELLGRDRMLENETIGSDRAWELYCTRGSSARATPPKSLTDDGAVESGLLPARHSGNRWHGLQAVATQLALTTAPPPARGEAIAEHEPRNTRVREVVWRRLRASDHASFCHRCPGRCVLSPPRSRRNQAVRRRL